MNEKSPGRTVNEIFQELIDHPDMADVDFSIVLDGAHDWPIVIARTSEEMVQAAEEAAVEGDPPYLYKAGQVRFEVSDGFPNERVDSFDHPDFSEAVTAAYHWQGETDAGNVKLRG